MSRKGTLLKKKNMTEVQTIKIEGEWFWGTSIHIITTDGHALLKLVIDKRCSFRGEIYDLNTHPDKQRQGYANFLMKEAEEEARRRGCKNIVLWVEKGSWQKQWYRRHGYEDEEFMEPPSDDTIWLEKFLNV